MNKLLVVVDYQYDFVDGSLGFLKAKELEDKIYNKVKQYKNNKEFVIFTYDTHYNDYLKTREGKALPVKHCIEGTKGHKLYGRLQEFKNYGDHFMKNTFSIEQNIIKIAKNLDIEEIELVGVATNICVISNAITFQTIFPNTKITVDASCCASFNDDLHEKALDIMEGLQMNIINRDREDK
ncbi:TPA: cysteine hydrolase [Clostridium botulinum]|nr:cysteine hydrolase [Clostridium botulinum]